MPTRRAAKRLVQAMTSVLLSRGVFGGFLPGLPGRQKKEITDRFNKQTTPIDLSIRSDFRYGQFAILVLVVRAGVFVAPSSGATVH